jgi:hypothetical protein
METISALLNQVCYSYKVWMQNAPTPLEYSVVTVWILRNVDPTRGSMQISVSRWLFGKLATLDGLI